MRNDNSRKFEAIVVGVSTGGVSALRRLLGPLPADFPVPILIVSHLLPTADSGLADLLDQHCSISVKEADEQDLVKAGSAYLAPANYHLLVERGGRLALSIDPPVNYARPSVDVLFESASSVYGPGLIAVVLTGAGSDGSKGLLSVRKRGGITIVQDPADAEMNSMPGSALQEMTPDHVAPLEKIPGLLMGLAQRTKEGSST